MNYWKRRDLIERNRLFNITEADLMKMLRKEYLRVSKEVLEQIELLYNQIAASGQPLTADQLYRNERYWKIISDIEAKLDNLANLQKESMTDTFKSFYTKNFDMVGSTMIQIDDNRVSDAIMAVWAGDGKNFSDRIWTNKRALVNKISSGLVSTVASGQNWQTLSKNIKTTFGVSYNQAQRLVRTELTHVQTKATIDKYRAEGVEEVRFIAENDCCPLCREHKDKVFKLGTEPLIPIHPNCRCTFIPIV